MSEGRAKTLLVAIDRIEGTTAILESDDGREFSVPVKTFENRPREGMMLRVPLNADGSPNWPVATVDRAAETKRRKDLDARVTNLKKGDRGGDLKL